MRYSPESYLHFPNVNMRNKCKRLLTFALALMLMMTGVLFAGDSMSAKASGWEPQNSHNSHLQGTTITISHEYAYRDFKVNAYSKGVEITCDANWISFYRTSFQGTLGKLDSYGVLYMPKENTGSEERVANVTVKFTGRDSRDGSDFTFKIVQESKYKKTVAPTIKVGDITYKNPTAVNGVVTINYDKWIYAANAEQTISLSTSSEARAVLSHRSTPVMKNNRTYLAVLEEFCDYHPSTTCKNGNHTLKVYCVGYSDLNGNLWNIVPEVDITVEYKDIYNVKQEVTYRVRFTQVRLAADPSFRPVYQTPTIDPYDDSSKPSRCPICCVEYPNPSSNLTVSEHIRKHHENYGNSWN